MKQKLLFSIISLTFFSIITYAQEPPEEGMEGPEHPGVHRGIMGPNMGGLFFVPGAAIIIENYRIKIMKIFTEAREEKIKLRVKFIDLRKDLDALIEKYQTDKSVSKDIVADLRNIRDLHDQVQAINKDAMKKIQNLNESREKEIKAAVDAWLLKVGNDTNELVKFIDAYKSRHRTETD